VQCENVQRLLDAYCDEVLSPEEATAVALHCEACPTCRRSLADRRTLLSALADPGLEAELLANLRPLPDNFTDQVLQRIADERGSGLNLLWPWLQRRWSASQYAGLAYALCFTLLIFTAGGVLLQWEQHTGTLSSLGIESQASWFDLQTRLHLTTAWFGQLWQTGLSLLR